MKKRNQGWYYMPLVLVLFLLMIGCSKKSEDNPIPDPGTVTDIDGNVYHTITIGTQMWLVENLKTTKYNDGSAIPMVTDNAAWVYLSTPGYCWYNNNVNYKNTYGALYNWYAVNTGKLAPTGWNVATDADWTILTKYLGGDSIAGGKMKSTGTIEASTGLWYSPNTGATNSSGFTAVPAGYRDHGVFGGIGVEGVWWSTTEGGFYGAWCRDLGCGGNNVHIGNATESHGYSVRCGLDL